MLEAIAAIAADAGSNADVQRELSGQLAALLKSMTYGFTPPEPRERDVMRQQAVQQTLLGMLSHARAEQQWLQSEFARL